MATKEIATKDAAQTVAEKPKFTPAQQRAWESKGEKLRVAVVKTVWDVADWYVQGAGYGFADRASEILDGLYSADSLYKMGSTATAWPAGKRDVAVSFGIHKVLAATMRDDESEGLKLLAQAKQEHWTVKQAEAALSGTLANAKVSMTTLERAVKQLARFTPDELQELAAAVEIALEQKGIAAA
jgi:hypothetical protein